MRWGLAGGAFVVLAVAVGMWTNTRAMPKMDPGAIVLLSDATLPLAVNAVQAGQPGAPAALLVAFVTPACPQCLELVLQIQNMTTGNLDLVVGVVDVNKSPEAKKEHNVTMVPFVKFFKKGTGVVFMEERRTHVLQMFVQRMMGPALPRMNSARELDAFKRAAGWSVVFFVEASEAHTTYLLEQFADKHRHQLPMAFVPVFPDEALPEGVTSVPSLLLFNGTSDAPALFHPLALPLDLPALKWWIVSNSVKPLLSMSPVNFRKLSFADVPVGWLVVNSTGDAEATSATAAWEAVARAHETILARGARLLTAVTDLSRSHAHIPEGMPSDRTPLFFVEDDATGRCRAYAGSQFTVARLELFLNDWFLGTVSESVPLIDCLRGEVCPLAGTTFAEFVNSTKCALIHYYTRAASEVALAEKAAMFFYQDRPEVRVGEVNTFYNDVPGPAVPGSFALFRGGEVAAFTGEKTLPRLLQFVDVHCPPEDAKVEESDK
eukprot:TRINITY_DN9496_c0_g1_i1.p1 TRINITY_DN9496_c0_g1~~TRINITY_DN9496_c0_g1_i1.p1  ORF type:complete len:491 (+),score=125.82 TRINITY_DN9496_c0_g1_i1:65-1537(+)